MFEVLAEELFRATRTFQSATEAETWLLSVQSEIPSTAKLQLDSSPPGADIEIDGSFVGSTPYLQVAEGEHVVVVRKAGFKNWERKVRITSGCTVHRPPNSKDRSAEFALTTLV